MNGPKVLAGMFATSGVLHFANPEPFEKIIPGLAKQSTAVFA